MLTRCPQCTTTFRVDAATLRAARGQVRCGHCMHRFDAIAQLVDDEPLEARDGPSGDASNEAAAAPGPTPAGDEEEPRSLTDLDLARIFVDERDWNARWDSTSEESTAPGNGSRDAPAIVVEEPTDLEEITLEGRRIEISGTHVALDPLESDEQAPRTTLEIVLGEESDEEVLPPLPTDEILLPEDYARAEGFELRFTEEDSTPPVSGGLHGLDAADELRLDRIIAEAAPTSLPHVIPPVALPATPPMADVSASVLARTRTRVVATDETDAELEDIAPPSRERDSRTALFSLMSLVLAIVLLLQVIHHHRQDLVRHPRFGPMLGAAYTSLGMPLSPNWDPTGYEVQQWGIAALPGDAATLRLRASVTNRAGFPQPYPLLRLSLEDLWGAEVGVRALEPREYLPAGTSPDRMMAPGQRTDAEVRIVDPGEDAVGFRVDVCVRNQGELRCAGAGRAAS